MTKHFSPSPLLLLLALLIPAFAMAQPPQPWTPDDILHAERVRGMEVAPDGSLAIWAQSSVVEIDGEEKSVAQLMMRRLGAGGDELGEIVQLTRGADGASSPKLSPDGSRVAFLTGRDAPAGSPPIEDEAKPQVWALPLGGGEPYPLTGLDRGVRDYAWLGDDTLLVLAQESPTAWEMEIKESKDTTQVVDDEINEPPTRLFRVDLEGGEVRRLTSNTDWIDSLAVSPDGSRAVVTAQQSLHFQFDEKIPPHTYLVDLERGERRRILTPDDGDFLPGSFAWSADGAEVYFLSTWSSHPIYHAASTSYLHHLDPDTGEATRMDTDWERGAAGGGVAPAPGGVVVMQANGVRYAPARYVRAGSASSSRGSTSTISTPSPCRATARPRSTRPPRRARRRSRTSPAWTLPRPRSPSSRTPGN